MDFYKLLLVGSGGFIGSIARYVAAYTIDSKLNALFPFGTLTVNIAGSLLLGMIYGWLSHKTGDSQNFKLLLATGFCGGFTTFSAFAYENFRLLEQKMFLPSFFYMLASVGAGILAIFLGLTLAAAFINKA